MPVLTQAEKDLIGATNHRVDVLEEVKSIHELAGLDPKTIYTMDAASERASLDIVDAASGHMAAELAYTKAGDAVALRVFDRATGLVLTTFSVEPDGCYIDGAMIPLPDVVTTFTANQHFEGSVGIGGNVLQETASGLNVLANVDASPDQELYSFNGNGPTASRDVANKGYVDGEIEKGLCTVVAPYSNTPTKAELVNAIQDLPYYENDAMFWGAEHDFYLKDVPDNKLLLVKYHPNGINIDPGTAGDFFFEKMRLAV